jgi:SAM-dependent methyltransferase
MQQSGVDSRGNWQGRYHADPQAISALSGEYDRLRYQSTMGALSRKSYAHAFEPGCATGELTSLLARVCDRVSAADISQAAVLRARERCAHWKNVSIRCADVRTPITGDPVDLIVFSELGIYFSAAELVRIARSMASRLMPGGEFVAVHWLTAGVDQLLHADAVHCQLLAHLPLRWLHGERHGGLRIDTWQSP